MTLKKLFPYLPLFCALAIFGCGEDGIELEPPPEPDPDTCATDERIHDKLLQNLEVNVSGQSAVVTWNSEYLSTGTIEFGLASLDESLSESAQERRSHSVDLGQLAAGQDYRIRVTSTAACQDAQASSEFGFHSGLDLSGQIREDLTLTTLDSPVRLTGNVQLAQETELTVEAGVKIVSNGSRSIKVFGTLSVEGTEENKVRFEDVLIFPGDTNSKGPYYLINIEHAELIGGSLLPPTGNSEYGSINLRDSYLSGLVRRIYIHYPVANCIFERNVFERTGGISIGVNDDIWVALRHNVFKEMFGDPIFADYIDDDYAIEIWARNQDGAVQIENNSFLSTDRINVKLEYSAGNVSATANYWNTINPETIADMIHDYNDDFGLADTVAFDPFLFAPHPDTPEL